MSNPEQVAFENLQRLAAMFRGIIEIAPELQKVSSLKGAQDEALARLDQIKAETAKQEAEAKRAGEAATAAANRILADAQTDAAKKREEAQKIAEAAKVEALQAVDAAKRQAAQHIADAKAAAVEHEKAINSLKAEYDEWRQRVQGTAKDHAALVSAVSEKQSEHDRIQAVIAEAKAKFG